MRYRRAQHRGGCYFFTLNLANRQSRLLIDQIDLLRTVVCNVRQRHPFNIDAMVVLPEHLHAVWTLPEGDGDYAMRWMLIKSNFSRGVPNGEVISASRKRKEERGIWQRRYWEHLIRDENDYARHLDYIHYNPVKHGHADRAVDWPYSSIHRYIRQGDLTADWACDSEHSTELLGER